MIELVLSVTLRSKRFEATFVADVVKEREAMIVSFGNNDVARLSVNEVWVVAQSSPVAGATPLVVQQRLVRST